MGVKRKLCRVARALVLGLGYSLVGFVGQNLAIAVLSGKGYSTVLDAILR